MAFIDYEAMAITATSSGTIATTSTKVFRGFLHAIEYDPSTASTILPSTDSSMAITLDVTGRTVLSLEDMSTVHTGLYFPRVATVTTTGAASTGAEAIPIHDERVVVTMTSGSTQALTATAIVRIYVS